MNTTTQPDITQTLSGAGLTVTTSTDFAIDTSSSGSNTGGNAFTLTGLAGPNGMTFTQTGSGRIAGASDGILITNYGSAALSIAANGQVTGRAGYGVRAVNALGTTAMTVTTNGVSASQTAISVDHSGTGSVMITANGPLISSNDKGIDAIGRNYSDAMRIRTGAIDADRNGISASHIGSGMLHVETTGLVRSRNNRGVLALGYGAGVVVETAAVAAASFGIFARNSGTGDLEITSTGTVSSANDTAIYGGSNTTGDLTITSLAQVTSTDGSGIVGYNFRGGNLTINSGSVTATSNGVVARNDNNTGSLTLTTTGPVTMNGPTYASVGLTAIQRGSGDMSVIAGGDIHLIGSGTRDTGIVAFNTAIAADMDIVTEGIYGGANAEFGINAGSAGLNGALTITTNGVIDIGGGTGILALKYAGTTNTITTNDAVHGSYRGVHARHSGRDDLRLTTNGTVSADANNAIRLHNYGNANTVVTINDTVSAAGPISDAISIGHSANGAVELTVNADVTGADGIDVNNTGNGPTRIVINNAQVAGRVGDGVRATSGPIGPAHFITLNHATIGAFDPAANAISNDGSALTITVNNGSVINGTILTAGGTDTVAFNAGSAMNGAMDMGDDDDLVTFHAGSDFSGITTLDGGGGGTDNDRLIFDGAVGTAPNAGLQDWERIDIRNRASVDLSNTVAFTTPDVLNIVGGSRLRVGGDLNHANALSMGDGIAGDQLVIGGNFNIAASATLNLDVDFATHSADLIIVDGNVNIAAPPTALTLNGINGAGAQGFSIPVILVDGVSSTGSFTAPTFNANGFVYDLYQINENWYLSTSNELLLPSIVSYEAYHGALLDQAKLIRYAARMDEYGLTLTEDPTRRLALWSRLTGGRFQAGADTAIRDSTYDLSHGALEAGVDVTLADRQGTRVSAGIYGGLGGSVLETGGRGVTGQIDSALYALGGTLTYLSSTGFYADAQLKHQWVRSDLTEANSFGTALPEDLKAQATLAGLELGMRFAATEHTAITPELQLTYAHLSADGFDEQGLAIIFDDADRLALRLGLRADTKLGPDGIWGHMGFSADVTHEVLGETTGRSGTFDFGRALPDWTGTVGLDVSLGNTINGLSFYGGANIEGDFSNLSDTNSLDGHLGLRFKW